MNTGFDWNDKTIARLTAMWNEGVSGGQIAEALGLSKNAVIGKIHRLGLSRRPNPITRRSEPRPPSKQIRAQALLVTTPVPESRKAPIFQMPSVVRLSESAQCRWPLGDPRLPGFCFCEAPRESMKSYCPEHHALSAVKMPVKVDAE
jgi:GcrA cell cycle regulator